MGHKVISEPHQCDLPNNKPLHTVVECDCGRRWTRTVMGWFPIEQGRQRRIEER